MEPEIVQGAVSKLAVAGMQVLHEPLVPWLQKNGPIGIQHAASNFDFEIFLHTAFPATLSQNRLIPPHTGHAFPWNPWEWLCL